MMRPYQGTAGEVLFMKKYVAEFIGTFVLVLFGCGTAALSGGIGGVTGIVGIALAFGLSIVAMAYCIGSVSGCHINPAVSFGMLLAKRMTVKDFIGYVIAQFLGAIAASGVLLAIVNSSAQLGGVAQTGLGADGFGAASAVGLDMGGAFAVEVILTFVFVLVVLGVTASEKMGSVAGIVIGLTLAFVHIMGIPLTGTSVNPARSFGPALLLGGEPLSQVWLFIVGPLVGAAIAALVWIFLIKPKKEAAI